MGAQVGSLTVACVLRSGGAYHAGHVEGLRRQVAHFMPSARFVCLSDMEVDCESVPLESGWHGWWSKIELFRHFKGRTLYLDLDTVIVADPAHLVTGRFTMIRNWIYRHLRTSGVMSWDGDYSYIADAFEPVADDVMRRYVTREQWGDQAWIAEQAGNANTFPDGAIVSYRYQLSRSRRRKRDVLPPVEARIVCFNGTHLPWDGPDWARQWWAAEIAA